MTWLKVKEVAKILNLTDSAIKKAIKKINMSTAMSKGSAGAVFGLRLLWKVCHRKHRTNTTTYKRNKLIMT